jgi:hypothetical protein
VSFAPLVGHIGHYWFVPEAYESHHWFGAGFLFVGVILVIESLAGGVWFRSRLRAFIWPGTAMFLGEGLVIVAFLDPQDRVIHFTAGVLVLAAGWMEMRYRFQQVTFWSANLLVVPALLVSAFEMGVIHSRGSTIGVYGHAFMGLIAVGMAGARLYQANEPTSPSRHAAMGGLVILLALVLLIIQP